MGEDIIGLDLRGAFRTQSLSTQRPAGRIDEVIMFGYKTSRYVITAPLKGDRELAYNGMTGALAVWEARESRVFQEVRDDLPTSDPAAFRDLLYGGYIVSDEVDELEILHQQYRIHRFNRSALILTIAPTLACNFGCDYCFQGQDKPSETMSQQVQDAIVDFVERMSPEIRHLHVAWYGGEPLLRVGIIEALSDRFIALCDSKNIKYDAMIVTNGFKLTPEVARSLHSRRVTGVQVTIDGDQEYHDDRRTLLNGGKTYDRIVKNLKEAVDAAPLTYSIRVNVDHRNHAGVTELIDDLAAHGLANRKNFRLYFAPVEAMTTGCHSVEESCMSKGDYGQLEAGFYRYAFDKGLVALPYPPRFHGTCGAVRPSAFVIVPTGAIHKCWDTVTYAQHAVGSIFDMDSAVRNQRTLQWLQWSPFNNDSCRNCRLLPNCAGACAYKFLHADDTRGEAATLPCPSWKYNIKERLLLRAEKVGAITAADWDPALVRTDPKELCTDEHIGGGLALPAPMQALYAAEANAK